MKVYRSLQEYEKGYHTVATIGTFDGVHLGHRKILQRLKDSAQQINGETVLISFHPHPRLVLFPENNPLRLLQTLEEKIRLLEEFGIDKLLLIPFTKEFSRTPSKAFVQDILMDTVGISKIVIGYDHHFGKNRTGNIDELREMSGGFGFSVEEIPAQAIDNANISSTKIRNALLSGEIQTANTYLGYPYSLSGKVVHGEKQGRELGYPTANIDPLDSWKLVPSNGIYFVKVYHQSQTYFGMMSIGVKPTMGEFERSIEVNIFDFDEDIYDQTIRIDFLDYIRGEEKFDSLPELVQAIDGDKAFCMAQIEKIRA